MMKLTGLAGAAASVAIAASAMADGPATTNCLVDGSVVYTFTNTTATTWTVPYSGSSDILLVGGGGGGGKRVGGGGGGGGMFGNNQYAGGNGGSGVVIIRYAFMPVGFSIFVR